MSGAKTRAEKRPEMEEKPGHQSQTKSCCAYMSSTVNCRERVRCIGRILSSKIGRLHDALNSRLFAARFLVLVG